MKKKFTIHLDAVLVIAVLACGLIILTIYQHSEIDKLSQENQALQWKELENSFIIDSQKSYIKKLELQISNRNIQ
ncbi:MAG: hypothetical protein ACJAT7_001913 [Psychromonas sp.]|jgi:hypothetical protein|uniref:hypothetical protein n=1 Tax=Psychromonas sp. TaxID=1884585 RepID=UPI0039E52507